MSTSNTNCLVCNSSSFNKLFTCTDHFVTGEEFELQRCSNCNFTFTQDIPSPEAIAPYYKSEEYISHSNTQKGLVNKLYHRVREIMLGKKHQLIKSLTPGKDLLDIGCGIGYFPYFMKGKGYNAHGMELDADARKFAEDNYQLKIDDPETLLSQEYTEKYNVVTLWHVMEHLHDPARYLKWIKKALKPEGSLVIALPNCASYDAKHFKKYWAAYDVPRHLWHFTPETFEPYLNQFGFELTEIKRLPFDAYYNSLMSAKYRKDFIALVSGFLIGLISNMKSSSNPKTTSSVIYILKKK